MPFRKNIYTMEYAAAIKIIYCYKEKMDESHKPRDLRINCLHSFVIVH